MQWRDAVQRAQRLACVVGAPQQQLPQLDEPLPSEPRQVDNPRQSVERLGSADVGGGLLAADVLLACLQREHETAAAVCVGCLPRDTPRHPTQVLLARREEAKRGAAEVKAIAQRLALPPG